MGLFRTRTKDQFSHSLSWTQVREMTQLNEIMSLSKWKPIIIFKHSTQCSISDMARNRLEQNWQVTCDEATPYFLDLIVYRNISNEIESRFDIRHQSPQVLLIKDARCTYSASHNQINAIDLKNKL